MLKKYLLFCLIVLFWGIGIKTVSAATPTTFTWKTTLATGNWNVGANWTGGTGSNYPGSSGAADKVIISTAATITFPVGTVLAGTISSISITGGTNNTVTLDIDAALAAGGLTLGAGTSGTLTINLSADLTLGGLTLSSGTANSLTFLGTSTAEISGTISMPSMGTSITIGSNTVKTTTVTFEPGSSITFGGNNSGFTNWANLNLSGTSGSGIAVKLTSGGSITNEGTGTIDAAYTTIAISGGTTSTIGNTGSFTANNTTITVSAGVGTAISNTGSLSGSALAITSSIQSTTISNSSIFTLNGGSSISFSGMNSTITNTTTGIFNAGTSNSACAITLSAQNDGIGNTGIFNLGSTSIITLTNSGASTISVANTGAGVFTLESDQFGSAAIGKITSTGVGTTDFTGNFNVQRYITGGSSVYSGYRLLSIPINISTNTSGGGNLSLAFLNQPASVTNANAVAGTTTSYGVYTGGPGGTGLSTKISNPTVYLYNETYKDNNASFISGKNVGINTIVGNTVTTISTAFSNITNKTVTPEISTPAFSIPVGNGVLLYYAGPGNATPAASPASTIITNIGYINQQAVKVNLWYTPGGATGTTTDKLSYTTNGSDTYEFFNSVGNPYPSTIDLKQVYTENTAAIGPNFWELYDQSPNNGYIVYSEDGSTSTPILASEYAVSGQGFFVVAKAINETLTFNEDQKVYMNLTSPTLLLAKKDNPSPGLNGSPSTLSAGSPQQETRAIVTPANTLKGLHVQLSTGIMNESCGIYFNNQWSDTYDINDASYLAAANSVNMSSYTSDGHLTAINKMADFTKNKDIKLYVSGTSGGSYNLALTDFQGIDTTLFNIYLIDHKNLDSVDIVRNKTYAFTITSSDTTTFGGNRFELAIDRKPLPAYQLISFTAQKVKDGVELTWKTTNEGDYTGFGIQKLEDSKQYTTLYNVQSDGDGTYTYTDHHPVKGDNTYRLEQIDIDSLVSYSKPLAILYNASTANSNLLSVYPNPARELITINFSSASSSSTGSYFSYIYNSEGRLVMQQTASGNTWTQDISRLRPGAYVINVKTASGNSIGNSKFLRVP